MNIDWEHELNANQRLAAQHPPGPLLVRAGPGSGKTRTLAYRVAYLVQEGVDPAHILALTFTNKAADEMRRRVDDLLGEPAQGLWVSTIHAACLRLLRQHGDAIGLPRHLLVFDRAAQEDALLLALERLGWSAYITHADMQSLQTAIEARKARLLTADHEIEDATPIQEAYAQVGAIYADILRESNALDFDDLIVEAARLLHEDDSVAEQVRGQFGHVLVDEFHDLNPAQYALLKLLMPPRRRPAPDIMIVADEHQSIYGWRGAVPHLVKWFQRDYRPLIIDLAHNYRSTKPLIVAARALVPNAPSAIPTPEHEHGPAPEHHLFLTRTDEQEWLVAEVQRLMVEEGLRPGDIAVLYRAHWLGDAVQDALQQAHIPVHRVQRESLFDRPGNQEILRYLQLLRSLADPQWQTALNFPRVLADELTMLQLRILSQRAGQSLADMARELDAYPEVSPLTRTAVRRFLTLLDQALLPHINEDADRVVTALFDALEPQRSPYSDQEAETLRGFAHTLRLDDEVRALRDAVDAGRPIALLVPEPAIDALCAAAVLEHALVDVLGAAVTAHTADDDVPNNALRLALAPTGASASPADLALTPRVAGSMRYSLSTVAWQLASRLLVSYETLDQARFVVYDIETTGLDADRHEIIEIGALTVDRGETVGQPFHTLVRPVQRIPAAASKIHGLTDADVRDAPPIESVLPAFLRYMGDVTLVGHNAVRFDNVFLNRALRRVLRRRLINPCLDTLELARRLLSQGPYALDALAERLGLPEAPHRALADAEVERDLLLALLEENRWQKELECLAHMLPVVALGMHAAGVPRVDENDTLWCAAARVARAASPWTLVAMDRMLDRLPTPSGWDADRVFADLAAADLPATLADAHWSQLRHTWERLAGDFVAVREDRSLEAFLGHAALASPEDEVLEVTAPEAAPAGRVTLMTLHNAKGTEFRAVFIIGAEEGHIPHWRHQADENAIAEERRVLYVGMTRAGQRLYLTSTRERQEGWRRNPSRFLFDLAEDDVRRVYHYGDAAEAGEPVPE
ncbi:MAG: UvrD-helicase domain-containing protein [Chloroflexi bacterium]|nr:UvrD-helicase domain-containing protein [Chloroflexota bacterium]MBU1747727.1 UvrD-helicase domain-containing protein [Chloroflexota bacterium]